jgi:microcystin-dependent protein
MAIDGYYLSEVHMFACSFAPQGWALANGQLLPINQNQALFSLLGTTYGGNGQTNFALPNLQGRVPIHVGSGHTLGETGGEISHTITQSEMTQHLHLLNASSANADIINPGSNEFGAFNAGYTAPGALLAIHPSTVGNAGGSQPHLNQQPFTVISFCVALQGVFPSQT